MRAFSKSRFGVAIGSLLLASSVGAQEWVITDLGTLGGRAVAAKINDSRQVVGYSDNSNANNQAFIWQNGSMVGIPLPGADDVSLAFDINNAGYIVGFSQLDNGNETATVWSPALTPTYIDPLPGGAANQANGINNNNPPVIVGDSETTGLENPALLRGFRFTLGDPAPTLIPLVVPGQIPEPSDLVVTTSAADINDANQIVGSAVFDPGDRVATYWGADGVNQFSSLLPVEDEEEVLAASSAINNAARSVGFSNSDTSAAIQGFYFDPQAVPPEEFQPSVPLNGLTVSDGVVPEGEINGWALDINDSGVIVGFSTRIPEGGGTELRATRWVNGVAEDLNDLVPGSGWNLVEASGINAEGCMVGNGFNPNNEERGFLLCFAAEQEQADEIPVPTLPQFGWLALVGLLCLFGIRRLTKQDA